MHQSFKSVRKNRGASGIDKESIKMFEANLEENLTALMKKLKNRGTFYPKPLKRIYIPKGNTGKTRPLGIPAVRDRVAQEVIRRLLEPIFEPLFHDHSYGFRPEKNCHQAIRKILELKRQGYIYTLDADIKSFFDNISHVLIDKLVAGKIADGNILGILNKFLKSGIMEDGKFVSTRKGTPQGGVISPLLANIVLNELDWELENNGYQFVRYADDFVVLAKTGLDIEKAMMLVKSKLASLGLELSGEKTKYVPPNEHFDFLGFRILKSRVMMKPDSLEKFKDKIRILTVRSHNFSKETTIEDVNRVIRGTARYFATDFSQVSAVFRKMDRWIRMRLRCMKKKRKSYNDNFLIPNKYFQKRGLLNMMDFIYYEHR
jgi:group II intron reverse transcriptase/maturase